MEEKRVVGDITNGGAPTLEVPLAFSEGHTRQAEEEGESRQEEPGEMEEEG